MDVVTNSKKITVAILQKANKLFENNSQKEDVVYTSGFFRAIKKNKRGTSKSKSKGGSKTRSRTRSPKKIGFYYFIGRLNPPHKGHIESLKQLLDQARGEKTLILLGSGPKPKKPSIFGKRTLDNPITFETKRQFIETKLIDAGYPKTTFLIKEMASPASDVASFVQEALEGRSNMEVDIVHVAGKKDGDATKLDFVKSAAIKTAEPFSAQVQARTHGVSPVEKTGKAMSATQVRKDAYQCFLDSEAQGDKGFSAFRAIYGDFYGELTNSIYYEMVEIAESNSDTVLRKYISSA